MSKNNIVNTLALVMTPENIQRYILGTKKNGSPRAVYDIIKDCQDCGKKKKKKKGYSTYDFYFGLGNEGKKKKKKKKKKNSMKYWHI